MENIVKRMSGGVLGGSREIQEGSRRGLERPCGSQGVQDQFFCRFLTSSETPGNPPGEFLGKYLYVFSIFWGGFHATCLQRSILPRFLKPQGIQKVRFEHEKIIDLLGKNRWFYKKHDFLKKVL